MLRWGILLGWLVAYGASAWPGEVDTSFRPRIRPRGKITVIVEQDDRRLLVGGGFNKPRRGQYGMLLRLHDSGRLDRSFKVRAADLSDSPVYRIQPLIDGRLGIGMAWRAWFCTSDGRFDQASRFGSLVYTIRANGSVIFENPPIHMPDRWGTLYEIDSAGEAHEYRIGDWFAWLRTFPDDSVVGMSYNRDKTIVHVSGVSGNLVGSQVVDLQPGPSNTIYCAGSLVISGRGWPTYRGKLFRFSGGLIDSTFGFRPVGTENTTDWSLTAIAVAPDGSVVFAAETNKETGNDRFWVGRVRADGSGDETFEVGSGPNGRVNGILILRSGEILVWGDFTRFDGHRCRGLVRLKAL